MKVFNGTNMRVARIRAGYTQDEVQAKTEEMAKLGECPSVVDHATLSRYETGRNPPYVLHLVTLAKLYDVTTDYLLALTDKPGRLIAPPELQAEDVKYLDLAKGFRSTGLSPETIKQVLDVVKKYEP